MLDRVLGLDFAIHVFVFQHFILEHDYQIKTHLILLARVDAVGYWSHVVKLYLE